MSDDLDVVSEMFILNRRYAFTPPVNTVAVEVANERQWRKTFLEGICIHGPIGGNQFMFEGCAVGEHTRYYFFITHGKDCIAKRLVRPHPHLRLVKG